MAITFVVGATGVSSGDAHVVTTSPSVDTTGVNLIVASVAGTAVETPTMSDSKGGNTWHNLSLHGAGTGAPQVVVFWCAPSNVGSGHTFTATYSALAFPGMAVLCFSGAGNWDNGDAANSTFGDTTIASGALTPDHDNDVVIATVGHGTTVEQPTINGGFSSPVGVLGTGGSLPVWTSYLIQTTATSANPTWSWTTSTSAVAVLTTYLAAAGPSVIRGRGRSVL